MSSPVHFRNIFTYFTLTITACLLLLIFRTKRIIRNSIQQSGSVNTDCSLQTYIIVGRLGIGINISRIDRHFRINQFIRFSVIKLISVRIRMILPCNFNPLFVHRRQKRSYRLTLRHTGQLRNISISVFIIYDKKITIAVIVGTVSVHSFTMSVSRMA